MSDAAVLSETPTTYIQVNSCQVHCIFWEGRLKHQAVYEITDLRSGVTTEQMASMGLWHMDDEVIPAELSIECKERLTAIRYGHGCLFLKDSGGLIHYDVKVRGT